MPIRGHSGVQGGAEMGCYATSFPGGLAVNEEHARSPSSGLRCAGRAWAQSGGDGRCGAARRRRRAVVEWRQLSRRCPRRRHAPRLRAPLRVHQDILVTHQMLVDPGETVVLLPVATVTSRKGAARRRPPSGGWPSAPSCRAARRRSAERVARLRRPRATRPSGLADRFGCQSGDAIRAEIARVVPTYAGIERLRETGDAIQIGGARLCEGGNFPTPDGKAHFAVVVPHAPDVPEGRYVLSTRRCKQFNSMVWQDRDPLTGADRDAVRRRRGCGGARRSRRRPRCSYAAHGELRARVHVADPAGQRAAFFPEANPLLSPTVREPVRACPTTRRSSSAPGGAREMT